MHKAATSVHAPTLCLIASLTLAFLEAAGHDVVSESVMARGCDVCCAVGFTGGTLDKLESVPGVRTNLTTSEFLKQLRTTGVVIAAPTDTVAPVDRYMRHLLAPAPTNQLFPTASVGDNCASHIICSL